MGGAERFTQDLKIHLIDKAFLGMARFGKRAD
jgi:hypothetical protein